MRNYVDVIGLWPSRLELAKDTGMTDEAVRKWEERKKIPSCNWLAVAEAAEKRNYPVDLLTLANLGKKLKKTKKPHANNNKTCKES